MSNVEIGGRLEMMPELVGRWRRRFYEQRLEGLSDRARAGRPRRQRASASTIGRWLAEDGIKPWQQRSWIFPRDPDFLEKARRVLDLYQGRWEGKLLEPGEMVISADAKPSIQARKRIHESAPPAPGRGQLVEHEYERMGALCYLDVSSVAGRR